MGLLDDSHFSKSTFFILPWKSYHTEEEIKNFASSLNLLSHSDSTAYLFALPFPLLKNLTNSIEDTSVFLGADAMLSALPQSFPESIAAKILQQNKACFVLIGKSEHRQMYSETESSINYKIKKALEINLTPFLCIGETSEELQEGKRTSVLTKQCKEGLAGLTPQELAKVAIIYEAPWLQKMQKKTSVKMLMESYFTYRQILAEVVGIEVFSRMRLIDSIPNDLEDLSSFLQTIQAKGLYITDPKLLESLIKKTQSLGIEITQLEALPPIPSEPKKAEKEETEAVDQTTSLAEIEKTEMQASKPKSQIADTILIHSKIESPESSLPEPEEIIFTNALQEPLPEASKETTSSTPSKGLSETLNEQPAPEISKETHSSSPLEESKAPFEEPVLDALPEVSIKSAETLSNNISKEQVKTPPEELTPETSPEISDESILSTPSKESPNTPLKEQTEAPLEKNIDEALIAEIEKSEIEIRIDLLMALDKELAECYLEIRNKTEILPKMRAQFPEKLTKMTTELNQLDPELQEQINRGNVSFFTENPDKANAASGVLAQLQELNVLLHETAAIPRDVDRLISKGRNLRKQLEDEWAYFRMNRKMILANDPNIIFPANPSQLLIKEPIVDLTPKDQGPSPLVGKRVAVVKTPPLSK